MKSIKKISIILLIVVLALTISGCKKEEKKFDNEEELIDILTENAKIYYEEFYYMQVGEDDKARENFVKKYSSTGITTSLENMSIAPIEKIKDSIDKFQNGLTKEKCDLEKTKAKIIPYEPYGKKDYDVEVKLVCGFDKKESKEEK